MISNPRKYLLPGVGAATSGSAVTAVLNPPVSVSSQLSQTAGGALAAATYFVKTTWVNAQGETVASNEVSLAVSLDNVLNVAAPANPPPTATGWNVYVSTTTGTETKQNGSTPIAVGTAWVEPTTGLVAGSALPGSNTATFKVALLGSSATPVRQVMRIAVTQNTWVDIRPSASAVVDTSLLVTPNAPVEVVVSPGDTVSFVQDTTAGVISLVQIAG